MDVKDYEKLIESLAELDVQLRNLDLQMVKDDIEKHAVSVSVDAKLVEYSNEVITIDVPFGVKSHSNDNKDDVAFTLAFTFRLRYRLDGAGGLKLSDSLVEEFIARNIPLNIWPYARELVSSLTSRMGLTPLWLQPLRIER